MAKKPVKVPSPKQPEAPTTFRELRSILPIEKLEEIDKAIRAGRPATQIADLIQEEYEMLTELPREHLAQQIRRHAKSYLDLMVQEKMLNLDSRTRYRVLAESIDFAEEMNAIAMMFKSRVYKLFARDIEMPLPMPTLRAELEAYANHLGKMARIFMDLGLIDKPPMTLSGVMEADTSTGTLKFTLSDGWQDSLKHMREEFANDGYTTQAIEV
jgi:HAMP domain-containing protein